MGYWVAWVAYREGEDEEETERAIRGSLTQTMVSSRGSRKLQYVNGGAGARFTPIRLVVASDFRQKGEEGLSLEEENPARGRRGEGSAVRVSGVEGRRGREREHSAGSDGNTHGFAGRGRREHRL
ncbi:hypothetical protein HAX54_037180 [Datura stramonium]|uniref:Uncharacterized protein n=1 Tax=Datura stramonium TaxID=4076 RepID=A0ABS8VL06_DATST|nr:hypothetical protein [Datura stramonium]